MASLFFGSKKYSTINDSTRSKEDTHLVLSSPTTSDESLSSVSASSSLRSRVHHYSTIAAVMAVLFATVSVTVLSRSGSYGVVMPNIINNLINSGSESLSGEFDTTVLEKHNKKNRRQRRRQQLLYASDLPKCKNVGDPVNSGAYSHVIPLEFVRKYTGTFPPPLEGFEVMDQAGSVDVGLSIPCSNTNVFPDDAKWCNTKGQQKFQINIYGMCLHDTTPDYYDIKGVFTDYQGPTGICRLVRVSHNAPGTWTEYETNTMQANGGAVGWAYGDEHVGMRLKYSLCPDNVHDKNVVKIISASFE